MSETGPVPDTDLGPAAVAATHDAGHGHGTGDGHGAGHGHGDDAEPLGPPDLVAWAYAIVGGAVGLVVVLALYVAANV
jgi:hypothetical protein